MLNNFIIVDYNLEIQNVSIKDFVFKKIKNILFEDKFNIFSQKKLYTYLILDAATRKRNMGTSDVDSIFSQGVDIVCLFDGEDAVNYEEAAPYVIDMTLKGKEDEDILSQFHEDFFANHWVKREGIFIRSAYGMGEIKSHLSTFTKIQDETMKWYFFRFYDPMHFLSCMQMLTLEKIQAFFSPDIEVYIPKRDKIQRITYKGNL